MSHEMPAPFCIQDVHARNPFACLLGPQLHVGSSYQRQLEIDCQIIISLPDFSSAKPDKCDEVSLGACWSADKKNEERKTSHFPCERVIGRTLRHIEELSDIRTGRTGCRRDDSILGSTRTSCRGHTNLPPSFHSASLQDQIFVLHLPESSPLLSSSARHRRDSRTLGVQSQGRESVPHREQPGYQPQPSTRRLVLTVGLLVLSA